MSWRPWTQSAKRVKSLRGHKRLQPDLIPHWKIVRGDLVSCHVIARAQDHSFLQVQVLCGRDKGRQGKVVAVARSNNRVFVGGLNTV
jgi:large subunit ribosomal protein L24